MPKQNEQQKPAEKKNVTTKLIQYINLHTTLLAGTKCSPYTFLRFARLQHHFMAHILIPHVFVAASTCTCYFVFEFLVLQNTIFGIVYTFALFGSTETV